MIDDPMERLRRGVAKMKGEGMGDEDTAPRTSYPVPGRERDLRSAVMSLITEATIHDARVVIAGIDDLEQAAEGPLEILEETRATAALALHDLTTKRNALGDLKRTTVEAARLEGKIATLEEVLAWLGAGTS